jgi:Phosphoribulokinase / Uridine kinase family
MYARLFSLASLAGGVLTCHNCGLLLRRSVAVGDTHVMCSLSLHPLSLSLSLSLYLPISLSTYSLSLSLPLYPLCFCGRVAVVRDIEERGRSMDNVLDQYLCTVKPSFDQFILPVGI